MTLHHNHIGAFNECLIKILHLEYLYLSHNEIASLPESGWDESMLKVLDLESNSLFGVPP